MAVPLRDYKQDPGILQHYPEITTMETLLETDQAYDWEVAISEHS